MSLYVASLNSGSNGNCYYVGNAEEAVLIDAGISCRETERRMSLLGLDMAKLKAIFISHEHIDHINGVAALVKKYALPVYITESTLAGCNFILKDEYKFNFTSFEPVKIGALAIIAFPKWHDAADPHSFIISCNGIRVGVFTDIGAPCENVLHYFKQCHAAILESNYDDDMLANGRYPAVLKKRISGKYGHLSNKQALDLFITHRPAFMSHVLLAHLSSENNTPGHALNLFSAQAKGVQVIHASRHQQTEIFHINTMPQLRLPAMPKSVLRKPSLQLRLF